LAALAQCASRPGAPGASSACAFADSMPATRAQTTKTEFAGARAALLNVIKLFTSGDEK
jgi:hypothetical protein